MRWHIWQTFAVILLITGTTLMHRHLVRAAHQEAQAQLTVSVNSTASNLRSWTHQQTLRADSWASHRSLLAAVENLSATPRDQLVTSPSQQKLRELLVPFLNDMNFQGYFVISKGGIALASSRNANVGDPCLVAIDPRFEDVFHGRAFVTKPMRSDVPLAHPWSEEPSSDVPTMFSVVPVADEGGDVIAALSFRISPWQTYASVFDNGWLGETGETYAFDRDALMLSETRFREQMARGGLLGESQTAVLSVRVLDPDLAEADGTAGLTEMAAAATGTFEAGFQVTGYNDFRGEQVIGAWAWLDDLDLGIASEIEVREAYGLLHISLVCLWGLSGVSVLLLLGLMLTESRRHRSLRYERNLLEERVAIRTAELESALKVKAEFLAVMSHEIRTPLNGVTGMVDVLLDSDLSEEQRKTAQTVRECGNTLLYLINDVLDFSKIEAGRLELERVPVEISALIELSVETFAERALAKSLALDVTIDQECPNWVQSDPTRLKQIVANLLSNAIKFTDSGLISLLCQYRNGNLVVTVRDTGIGMSDEARINLFEAFRQAEMSTTRRFGGTGLGMAIVKNIIDLFDGRIDVTSAPGEGTEFVVTIPAQVCSAPESEHVSDRRAAVVIDQTWVLLADDNAVNRKIGSHVIEKLGLHVDLACDGAEAVAKMMEKPYQAVLMDCLMPNVDGYEATRLIRALPGQARKVPIIAVTANAMPEDRQRCLDAGMNDYVAKPLKRAELERVLLHWLPQGANQSDSDASVPLAG